MSIDPHCEKYYWITPYVYCLDNPEKLVDPDRKLPCEPEPETSGVPAQQPNGTYSSAQASTYMPAPSATAIRSVPTNQLLYTAPETVTATPYGTQQEYDAMPQDLQNAASNPVIQGTATGALITMGVIAVPEAGTSLLNLGDQATIGITDFINGSKPLSTVTGILEGVCQSILPIDAPIIQLPLEENTLLNQAQIVTQTFATFLQMLNEQKDLPNQNTRTPAQQNPPKPNDEKQK